MENVLVQANDLKAMIVKRLTEVNLPRADAETVADVLIFAELRGVVSHGTCRVEHYCNRIRAGGININPGFAVEFVKPTMGRLDAKGGMGHVASKLAAEKALDRAKEHGMAMVGVYNSSHNGALAYFAQMALDRKMAALVCTHTNKLVAPFGGRFAFLGSNPMAFAYPGRKQNILVDMATSEIPWGKLINYQNEGKPVPLGLAQDAEGNDTTDPAKAVSLTAFGGVKGYSISIMIEALTGLLVGGVFGPHLAPMYEEIDRLRNLSSFFLAIDPSVFSGGDGFLDVAQQMIDELHAQSPKEGFRKVLVPGEIEDMRIEKNKKDGIAVPKDIHDFLAK